MTTTEMIDTLLADIRALENSVSAMKQQEQFPASFFSQTFDLSHHIITSLHQLEAMQIELLQKQMEEHQRLIHSLPQPNQGCELTVLTEQPTPVQPAPPTATVQTAEPTPVEVSHPNVEPIVVEPTSRQQPVSEPATGTVLKESMESSAGISLNEVIERKNLADFRKAFSLNDRFRFRRELFGGNEEQMNQVITDLNELHSLNESLAYLQNRLQWNPDEAAVADFIHLLEKRFL
ncbi:MAG: hypothetical protein SPD54_13450 [Parabacteroides sp.]|nr:hypothetical protein [Parabacteroides sp.]